MSLKNRSQFSSTLDNELLNSLKEVSADTKIPISKLLDTAVEKLIRDMQKQNKEDDGKYHIHINVSDDN